MRACVGKVGGERKHSPRAGYDTQRPSRPTPTLPTPQKQYTGGPQNLPAGFDGSAGTIPGGYPFTEQITDPTARTRALTCELQNGRAAMLGVTGAMMHSQLDSCDHHFFYPITHN